MEIGDEYRNGDGRSGASGASRSDDSADEEESALEAELSLEEPDAAARTLHALNALRKARQHYDVTLLARGVELPAHRALLAALSPAMLASLPAAATATPLRLDVDPDALHALLDYAYTGRLRVKDATAARRLYRAAALLRVESARAHLADRLLRRITPQDCLTLRSLPDLAPPHRRQLDAYVAQHFDEVWGSSALAALPLVRLELLRETSADSCGERAATLASAALAWLRASPSEPTELAARSHLLYVDAGGALRDCGDLPAARGDAPDLEEYKKRARERDREAPRPAAGAEDEGAVVAAKTAEGGARAVLILRGALVAAQVAWRGVSASDTPRGGRLAAPAVDDDSAELPTEEGPTRARMSVGRCAVGAAELGGRLVVCGGYDSARVLRSAEAYDPEADVWAPLPDMRRARARFPAARLGARLYVLGGSDGYSELDSVDVLSDGAWVGVAALPVARQYAAAAAHEARGELYVVGGSAGGRSLRAVHRYDAAADAWSDAPPLATGRSQCAAAVWAGALWALGGCDEWRCLASTETLALDGAEAGAWSAGPALPSARRSVGACVWRGALWAAGGSAGAASLRCTVLLAARGATWRPGPSLRRPRAAPALVPVGASLFAAGGYSGKRFLSCVECLHEPDGVWTTLLESVEVTPDATRLSLTPSGRETEEAV
ncbi:influenza virus NS1A-binding protein homolog B-like [Pieris napi]|uniref:influenza virus NS1A-binding protein homolog B-like n=1 Tax=Pieris napi TaxID=78633 RepID=UPI001FBBC3E0|nr:influenza virus NS1A-binding protein homolog B-like [Pieris napi]